jgi:microsomal dipeptidase-like Zn-dependent dipeptidase
VHADWLERAWRGGLRLMVMLAVNNEWMCKLPGFTMAPGRTPADMEAVDLQLDAALAFEAQLDQQAGGPGKGWYRIVRTPQEAATVVAAGKLAVILGIEVDYVFNSYPSQPPTPEAVKAAVQAYYEKGVRYVFPIHFADNAFGGTALQNAMDGVDVGVAIPLPPIPPIFPGGTIETPYVLHTVDGKALGYQFHGGRRNSRGLTDLGGVLIEELIAHQMIFDVDHMSWQTRSDVLGIAERNGYPVLSGHSGFIDVVRGDKSNEGQQTAAEVDRIRRTGGMVAPIIAQGNLDEVVTWTRPDGTSIPHVCGATTNTFVQPYLYAVERMNGGPVGIGTDFNGFAGVPGPITGPDRCPGGAGDPHFHLRGLIYPFIAVATGVQLDRSAAGQRTFEIDSDGLVHVGMLPDFIASLSMMGVRDNELEAVLTSANAFVDTWSLAKQSWQAAFQANTGNLWIVGHDDRGDMQLGMRAGTNPSIAALRGGGWECAFQANTGNLWLIGNDDRGDMQLGMQAGTSPSLTAVPGGWQCAFQASTGTLWIVGTVDDRGDTRLGMMNGTSPSITQLRSGDWQAAFQANTGNLWIVGHDDRGDMQLGMRAGTSPSIAALRGGGWECAFQANTGNLWVIGNDDRGNMQLGMQAGTSPSLTALPDGAGNAPFKRTAVIFG